MINASYRARIKKALEKIVTKEARLSCDECWEHAMPHVYTGFSVVDDGVTPPTVMAKYRCKRCRKTRFWGCFDPVLLVGEQKDGRS